MSDREQARRDAEFTLAAKGQVTDGLAVRLADHCLDLLAELGQIKRKLEQTKRELTAERDWARRLENR